MNTRTLLQRVSLRRASLRRASLRQFPLRQIAVFVGFAALAPVLSACNGGLRPTLVEDPPPTTQPALELDLPAAPTGTSPLPPASDDFPLEASVDDALIAWAADRSIPYVDSCALVNPRPGELCDVATERDTVRLLGPAPDQIWYVVTILETDSFDFGTGYRVTTVEIAGQ